MHAVIESGGKQYRVEPGGRLRVERLAAEEGEQVEIAADDFEDLCTIHLCERLEQFPRSRDHFRPEVFRRLAKRLGGVALEAYDRVIGEQEGVREAARA